MILRRFRRFRPAGARLGKDDNPWLASIASAILLAVCLLAPKDAAGQDFRDRTRFLRQNRSGYKTPGRPPGHSPMPTTEPDSLGAVELPAGDSPTATYVESPIATQVEPIQYEVEVPTPGDRPAFEKADTMVGEEPGEQPPWSLTNLWDYDERRSRSDAGRNPLIERRWHIGGSLVQSFVMNPMKPKDRFNGPVTWTDRADDYQLNQLWLFAERTTDTSCDDFDLGGRVDFNYGTNYRWQTSAGLEDTWNANIFNAFYGIAFPQAYIETAYQNVKVKWGHFISPIGYFTVDTSQNFFFTLPYTYQYGEPFTHWGALATWSVTDELVLGSGVTRGWDNFNGDGSGSHSAGWIGTATYTFENQASLAYVGTWSREFNNVQAPNPQYTPRYLQSLVFSLPMGESWTYVAQSDFGTQSGTVDASGTRPIGTARWYGINQYLFWVQNPCVAWGMNFEWFRDEEGFRVGALLPTLSDPISKVRGLPTNRFGYMGNFFQLTFGPKFTPSPNLFIRPNARFDWFEGTSNNPGSLRPFNDGTSMNQFILGFDVGLTY